jgi:hypothetical protein
MMFRRPTEYVMFVAWITKALPCGGPRVSKGGIENVEHYALAYAGASAC